VKTQFMSRETDSAIQGKRSRPIREHDSSSIGSKQAQRPKQTNIGRSMPHGIRTRDTRTAQIPKLGVVGADGLSADHAGRPTSPLQHRLTPFDVAASHWLLMSVPRGTAAAPRCASPWLPLINSRGGALFEKTSTKCSTSSLLLV